MSEDSKITPIDPSDWLDDVEPDESNGLCDRCGGKGFVEYYDAPETWGEDSPSERNHLVECPECGGSGDAG